MKKEISENLFLRDWPESRENQFSRAGKIALFDYLIELEEGIGIDIEYDPIGFCCEYTEYEDLKELNKNYGKDFEGLDELREYTDVIKFDGGIIVRNF